MKILALLLVACPLFVHAQNIVTASAQTTISYDHISNALSAGNVKEALTSFENTISFLIREGRSEELAREYFGMALVLALNGVYKESIRYHKKAIKSHARFHKQEPTEISINLGLTYYLAGKDRKAKRILGDSI